MLRLMHLYITGKCKSRVDCSLRLPRLLEALQILCRARLSLWLISV